ncbi:MAG: phage tail assembly protein [Magnetospirillum sp.]|nr:phage tail assembly protein [Magnetospirillum sp.]
MFEINEPLVLTLRKPVAFAGQTVESLTLREPTAGEMEKADGAASAVASNILLIAFVAGVTPGSVRLLCKRDYEEAVAYLAGFTAAATATEGASSGA